MKKTININLGGRDYTIAEDAYLALNNYLNNYRTGIQNGYQPDEVMEELEAGIADHFDQKIAAGVQLIDLATVNEIIAQMGMPDGSKNTFTYDNDTSAQKGPRKFFRDPQNKAIGGVCAGLAAYFNFDILLIRILFIILLICGSLGFWLYIILWIIAPKAETPEQRCQMRGWAPTPENIKKVSNI